MALLDYVRRPLRLSRLTVATLSLVLLLQSAVVAESLGVHLFTGSSSSLSNGALPVSEPIDRPNDAGIFPVLQGWGGVGVEEADVAGTGPQSNVFTGENMSPAELE